MATTHLEVYRPFKGGLRPHPLRFWPVLVAGLRVATRKKLPLLLLYTVPGIATVILSFLVYAKFAAEEQILPATLGGGIGLAEMLAKQAMERLEVRNQIIEFNAQMGVFALLAAAWFGSGLLCDDRRAGAHQLYFARPLTRLDYFLGKFLCSGFFAALAMLVPGLVICLVASYSSPDWSFLREEGDVVLRTVAFSLVWIVVSVSIILGASSLVPRKSFALAGVFAVFMLSHGFGVVLAEVLDDVRLCAFSLILDVRAVGMHVFAKEDTDLFSVEPGVAWPVLGAVTAVSLLVVALRLRRLEVVA